MRLMDEGRVWKGILLAMLVFAYPVLFLYNQNVELLLIKSLWTSLGITISLGILVFGIFFLFFRKGAPASIATFVIAIFFFLYGFTFDNLVKPDIILITHYKLLPIYIFLAIYLAILIGKLQKIITAQLQSILLIVVGCLTVINIISIVPLELQKSSMAQAFDNPLPSGVKSEAVGPNNGEIRKPEKRPDVYFIILDEYASFEAMKGYWKNNDVDLFRDFLLDNGFFIAEKSRIDIVSTMHQMAGRLNMRQYSADADYPTLYKEIAHNAVMTRFESYGYSTVVIDGAKLAISAKPTIQADYNFEYDATYDQVQEPGPDEFQRSLLDMTVIRAFPSLYQRYPFFEKHIKFLLFSLEKPADLKEIPSPKFVYSHVLLPHVPFLFDENGRSLDVKNIYDWNYYLGQYKFTQKKAEELVRKLLANADPENPPIIILQSDHGPRNHLVVDAEAVILPAFPEEYKSQILNALYLPGYDTSKLPQDLNPYQTFPLIFQYYFGE